MKEREIEGMLQELGCKIPINQELKSELRKSFEGRRKTGKTSSRRYIAAACIALLILSAGLSVWFLPANKVQADALIVQNYKTYMKIESNQDLTVAEYNGVLYVPSVQEGIFKMEDQKRTQLYEGHVSLVKISPDGRKLAFYEDGNVGVIDLTTHESKILQKSDSKLAYESPAWFGKDELLYTKIIIHDSASNGIFKLNLSNMEETRLASGTNASYINGKNSLLYQQGDNIVVQDLASHKEKMIDQGTQPSVSPDGNSIAYTKLDIQYEAISENVKIEKVLQNIWVADMENYNIKTMITSNVVLEDIDKEEWLKELKPSNELQMLSLSGRYCYLFPTWSSDSKTIYALRRDFQNRTAVVVKIELGREELSASTTVERYLQSVMLKDEDYQSGLIAFESNAAKELENSSITSFHIISEGNEEAKTYVDAEIMHRQTDSESAKTTLIRFYLSDETGQFYIVDMKEKK